VTTLVLALRGAAAIGVLGTLAGGVPRVVLAGLAITVGLWTALVAGTPVIDGQLVIVAARELVVGATIGVIAAVPLLATQAAGRLVDLAAGSRGPYGTLFGVLAAAVFVAIDGHVAVVAAITDSFARVPAVGSVRPRLIATVGELITAAVRLAVPWLVTAAVVQLAVGVGARLAGRSSAHVPGAAAIPAALVMITATLIATLAVAIAALVRSGV
jgi:flagellar biosynthesis protein FliR